ncbi:hypothetical protein JBL43_11315 [Aureibaculum sp. A20]|uniref:WG repeat-containing protein n=1 Tax=Aureibaculum flavum TaxID=2795986 RepID=A0ABS0WSA9_9FLAO|nr:hypothetical protein [Aureibaculum flavum]MBJ2174829.1 hypothetical protein [Aureibaculum flavum]
MNKFLFTVIIYLTSISITAQDVIKTPIIDLIAYDNDAYYYLFQKDDEGNFNEIYLDKSTNKDYVILLEPHQSNSVKTLHEIQEKYDNTFYTTALASYTLLDFKNLLSENNWILHNSETDEKNTTLLKPISEDIISINELTYSTRLSAGLGGSIENQQDDKTDKWRIKDREFLTTLILSLGNDKYMNLYFQGNSIEGILIPFKKENLLVFDDYEPIANSNISINDNRYNFRNKELLTYFNPEDFYQLQKDKNQYRLINHYGTDRLKKAFDSIFFSPHYIIGKTSTNISIYNFALKPLEFNSLQQVYFYHAGIEILDTEGAYYLDSEGNKILTLPPVSYFVCGTVSSNEYRIIKNKDLKTPFSISSSRGSFGGTLYGETLQLRGFPKNSKVSFLNNSNQFSWDGNSSYVGEINIKPRLLKVTQNSKVGIFTYEPEKAVFKKATKEYFITKSGDSILKPIPTDLNKKGYVKVTEVLPLIYDNIEMNTNDGLIYFYKDNKVAIYPNHKTVQFDSMEQVTKSFYKISRDGKNGWLDTKTFKEYY